VGVGLLGGSAALAIKAAFRGVRVAGVGRRWESLQQAARARIIDACYLDPAEPVGQSDLVILATPVCAFGVHLGRIAPYLKPGALVTDVGSTKSTVVRLAEQIMGRRGSFVGSHPMAGGEQKGPSFARADLFRGATCIITPTPRTSPQAARSVDHLWRRLGMRTVRMSPSAHDRAMAAVSHLPHALAAILMRLPSKADLDVSARGFTELTRLASGDPEVWRDVFLTNRKAMLAAIDAFDEDLIAFRDLVETGDAEGIRRFLASAKRRRDATIANQAGSAQFG
jgi:prephenate dehydrogenase